MLIKNSRFFNNGAGWQLSLTRYQDPTAHRVGRPVLLLPGFAMNAFILGYHPTGHSIASYLAARGYDVFSADLRGQGASHRTTGRRRFDMVDVGVVDVAAALRAVLADVPSADGVDVIGCSLGATFAFIQAAWAPNTPMRRIINIGGPLRWTAVHPIVRGLTRLPVPWRWLPIPGTRRWVSASLPLVIKYPSLLRVYLHAEICDLSDPATLTQTIENPEPTINAEIVRWIRHGDLRHQGRNLTEDMAQLTHPLLTIIANADGIVPEDTVCSAHNVMSNAKRRLIYAGDHRQPMAHADLFMSSLAESRVFKPLADWLDEG